MVIIPAEYGPGMELVYALKPAEQISICAGLPFEKATSFSRMKILTPSGPLRLSIPVKKCPKGSLLCDVQADNLQKWQHQHWRSIASAYGKSPFFHYYAEGLEEIFLQKKAGLAEFTASLLRWTLLQYFPGKQVHVNLATAIPLHPSEATPPLPNPDHSQIPEYRHVFGTEFVQGLSVLDHLFCAGPKSIWRLP